MYKNFIAAASLAAFAATASPGQAAVITGTVDFTGTTAINGTGPLDASAFTSFTGVAVDVGTGAYSGTVGTAATLKPFSFNPTITPISALWSFSVGSTVYSFDLTSLVKDFQGVPADAPGLGTIRVSGTGTAHITGYTDTPASFVLHASGGLADLQLAFGSSTAGTPPPSGVPDGGNTLLLLGSALSGLAFLRCRLA